MGISGEVALAAAKKYTAETVIGGGALKGKNCTIKSITEITGGHRVTFEWTLDDGTVQTDTMDVMDGTSGDYVTETELTEALAPINTEIDSRQERINLFDCTNITTGKYRKHNLNISKVTSFEDVSGGWCSNQTWTVKKGDTIYVTNRYLIILIYDSTDTLVEYVSAAGWGLGYVVTNDNAKYFTIQAGGTSAEYLTEVMISINKRLPERFVPYSYVETKTHFDDIADAIPADGKAKIDKGFLIISFDAFNLDDDRLSIVNEFGMRASGTYTLHPTDDGTEDPADQKAIYDALMANGWDCHLYSNVDWPSNNSYYVDNPSAEIQAVWDSYIKDAVDYAKSVGVYNATAWGCRGNRSCVGLENACRKNGIKMIRGGMPNEATVFYGRYGEEFRYSVNQLTGLTSSNVNKCISLCQGAAAFKYGLVLTTHALYDTEQEAEANNSVTPAQLRTFLTAVKELVDAGTLEVITFREAYRKYYLRDAIENDYERLIKYNHSAV